MSQILEQKRQPEPANILVERVPVKEGAKLSEVKVTSTWEDLRGLSWVFTDEWS